MKPSWKWTPPAITWSTATRKPTRSACSCADATGTSIWWSRKQPAMPRPKRAAPKGDKKSAHRPELVVITGLSGSGKGSVLKALEDLGFYAVDNMPVELIPKFAELAVDNPSIRA